MATPTSSMATPTAPASEASEDPDPSEADECEDGENKSRQGDAFLVRGLAERLPLGIVGKVHALHLLGGPEPWPLAL